MPQPQHLLMQAKAKRDQARGIRDMSRFLSVHADKALFERDAKHLEWEAERLEQKASAGQS